MFEETYARTVGPRSEQLINKRVRAEYKSNILSRAKTILKFMGPAFIVSVAYIDPPNMNLEQIKTTHQNRLVPRSADL